VDVESILCEEEVWSRQASVTFRKGNNFWSDRLISIEILLEFPEAFSPYSGCVESIVGEEEVWSRQARE
jgi:hypothetical protein